ncbi:outer dynein arm-docking complex subunit 4-like [Eurosta solidaginis]|uniref:outer dynein arm-docking complex subunit 4-like n=1 Tax=Eurosta solidaginis TaxID=178769 RepID=UPI00353093E9
MQEVAILPWEKIAWSDEHVQLIYRDWGLFYTHKQQLDIAANYYDKSLELKEDDARALYFRSQCKRSIAQTQGALEDGLAAGAIDTNSAPINLEICDALYELNQFENCKVELHDNTRKFYGKKVSAFMDRLIVVNENFNDSIGETLGPFILRNEKIFAKVLEQLEREKFVDPRPLWKVLREQGKCDVLSILEKEEVLLSPREIARRERAFKVFNQIYYNKSWIDVLFLKSLRENLNLLLPQCKVSTPLLRHLTSTKYVVLKKFLKMLQARSPLYNEHMRKCPDKKVWEKHRQAHLNHIQYQTRRNMLTILRTIRHLRERGKIDKLSKYVEEVMGDYVVLKTHRVMPWKFEFLNEVYNTLALAYTDRYLQPLDAAAERDHKHRLLRLLRIPSDKNKDRAITFVFGDKSTYQEPDATDYTMIAYKKYLNRLEKRIYFSKYSIEKCYLLHEIARSHLDQNRFDECCSVARKAIEESKNCNSNIWRFLSTLLICKSHAVLHKVERAKEILDEAYGVAKILNSPELTSFIDSCRQMNEAELSLKKRTQSSDSMRRRRSKMSLSSQYSQVSKEGSEGSPSASIQ